MSWTATHPQPVLSLRRTSRTPEVTGEDPETSRFVDEARPKRLFCRLCGFPVTSEEHRTAIEGRHVHHRINPAGFEFEIGCFAQAGGAMVRGVPTAEHSWFLPYSWSYSLCRGCGCHLGWFFEGAEPPFHGLILNRLEAEDPVQG